VRVRVRVRVRVHVCRDMLKFRMMVLLRGVPVTPIMNDLCHTFECILSRI